LDRKRLFELVDNEGITQIYHLAAILSASGEANPLRTWDINMDGLFNVLEVARERKINKVFFPSSIAVFGKDTPAINTPQHTILNPTTVYGMSKVAGEHWAQYYHLKYGLDIRLLRYPGIIGYQSDPGGGTTDYAVDIFHKAVLGENYTCFLKDDTALPMIYMEDAIRATVELMEAPAAKVKLRTGYNLSGMSFTPKEVTAAIQQHYPTFEVTYEPDFRQQIAESWPQSIDDSVARAGWGWQPSFDLEKMTEDMILNLKKKYK
jgi:nucleoside-diphosphate-sugar epimerase